jgi:single-strand DNA-binding protein
MTMQIAAYGRLGQDPRAIETTTGNTMAVGSVAVDMSNARDEDAPPLWLGIVAFGKQAEALLRHSKGDLVSVSGRAQMNRYTTRDGEEREQLQVVSDSLMSARIVRPAGGRRRQSQDADDGAPFDDALP